MNEKIRPAWVEINKEAAINNFLEIRRHIRSNVKICTVLKADGYSMGAAEMAKMYVKNGADMLAVAIISEALDLRKKIKGTDILTFGYTPEEYYEDAINNDIALTIYNYEHAVKLNEKAKKMRKFANIHIKVETGMNRLGFSPTEDNAEIVASISKMDNIKIQGIYTHFATADEKDKAETHIQANRFLNFIDMLEKRGIKISVKHAANSAAVIEFPEYHFNMVRAGIILTGYYPLNVNKNKYIFRPCLKLKAKVANVKKLRAGEGIGYGHIFKTTRETIVGTIPLGYADGFSRIYSHEGYVVIKGIKCPILGNICMDQFMVDLSDVENPRIGDDVIIFGDGTDGALTAEDAAHLRKTITCEVLTGLSKRLPRKYV